MNWVFNPNPPTIPTLVGCTE